jgi:diguanylate cyclase (GGDEF)-like protein
MKRFKDMPLSIFVLLSLLLAIGISFGLYFLVLKTQINTMYLTDVKEQNEEIALSATSYLESTLNEQINTLIGVSVAHTNLLEDNQVFDDTYYESIIEHNDNIVTLEVWNKDDLILYSSNSNENRVGIDVSEYYLLDELNDINEVEIGGLIYDPNLESLTLEVLFSGSSVNVYGKIGIDYFKDYGIGFEESFPGKDLMILDKYGIYLYDSSNDYHLIRYRYLDYEDLINLEDSEEMSFEINGQESLVSISHFTSSEWTLVVYESVDHALELNALSTNFFTVTIGIIVFVFIGLYLVFDVVVIRELQYLNVSMNEIGKRNFEVSNRATRFKETKELRGSFVKMRDALSYYTTQLEYLAYHDSLTGIPSLNKAKTDYEVLSKECTKQCGFLYIDIERFKVINDNYGYDVGDKVLQQIGQLLHQYFEYFYRVGGDEFLALLEYKSNQSILDIIEKINKKLQRGITIEGHLYGLQIKVGVSLSNRDVKDFNELFQNAVIALQNVKESITKDVFFFDDSTSDYYRRLARIELLVQSAFNINEFTTIFQPVVDIKTKRIRGFEALSRWKNKDLGDIYPDEFIPVLERTKKVSLLDELVLTRSLRLVKFIKDEYDVSLIASVNMSVETIMRDNFVQMVTELLDKFDYDPHFLELEITESTFIHDFDTVVAKMAKLKAIGVKFSEDDFGDGYSSLTYLSKLDIDTLKISKNFLPMILSSVENRVLVQTIIDLSKRLGFYTIVEGVEDSKTLKLFEKYGCDYVQGYLFYRPMSDDDFMDLIRQESQEE